MKKRKNPFANNIIYNVIYNALERIKEKLSFKKGNFEKTIDRLIPKIIIYPATLFFFIETISPKSMIINTTMFAFVKAVVLNMVNNLFNDPIEDVFKPLENIDVDLSSINEVTTHLVSLTENIWIGGIVVLGLLALIYPYCKDILKNILAKQSMKVFHKLFKGLEMILRIISAVFFIAFIFGIKTWIYTLIFFLYVYFVLLMVALPMKFAEQIIVYLVNELKTNKRTKNNDILQEKLDVKPQEKHYLLVTVIILFIVLFFCLLIKGLFLEAFVVEIISMTLAKWFEYKSSGFEDFYIMQNKEIEQVEVQENKHQKDKNDN